MNKLMTLTVGSLCAFALNTQSVCAAAPAPTTPPAVMEVNLENNLTPEQVAILENYDKMVSNFLYRMSLAGSYVSSHVECDADMQDELDMAFFKVNNIYGDAMMILVSLADVQLGYEPFESISIEDIQAKLESMEKAFTAWCNYFSDTFKDSSLRQKEGSDFLAEFKDGAKASTSRFKDTLDKRKGVINNDFADIPFIHDWMSAFFDELYDESRLRTRDVAIYDSLTENLSGMLDVYVPIYVDSYVKIIQRIDAAEIQLYNEIEKANEAKRACASMDDRLKRYEAELVDMAQTLHEYKNLLTDADPDKADELNALVTSYIVQFSDLQTESRIVEKEWKEVDSKTAFDNLMQRINSLEKGMEAWRSGLESSWQEKGGPKKLSQAELAALYDEAVGNLESLQQDCAKGYDKATSLLEALSNAFGTRSEAVEARYNELCTQDLTNNNGYALILNDASQAKADGTLTRQHIADLNSQIAVFEAQSAAYQALVEDLQHMQDGLDVIAKLRQECADTKAEIEAFEAQDIDYYYANITGMTLSLLDEVSTETDRLFQTLFGDWVQSGCLCSMTAEEYAAMTADGHNTILAAIDRFHEGVANLCVSLEELQAKYDDLSTFAGGLPKTFQDGYDRYNADGLDRCVLYTNLHNGVMAVYNEKTEQVEAFGVRLEACSASTVALALDGRQLESDIETVRKDLSDLLFYYILSIVDPEVEAEYNLRYGIEAQKPEGVPSLYVDNYVVSAGQDVTVPFHLKSDATVGGFQFFLKVPVGLVPEGSDVNDCITFSAGAHADEGTYVVGSNYTDGLLRVAVSTSEGFAATEGDEEVVYMHIKAIPEGDFPVILSQVKYTDPKGNPLHEVEDYAIAGNVRAVSLASFGDKDSTDDLAAQLARMLSTDAALDADGRPVKDTLQQADVTGDGRVTISDITTAVRLLGEQQ